MAKFSIEIADTYDENGDQNGVTCQLVFHNEEGEDPAKPPLTPAYIEAMTCARLFSGGVIHNMSQWVSIDEIKAFMNPVKEVPAVSAPETVTTVD